MARPRKTRTLLGLPSPALYIPAGWTRDGAVAAEVAIEDFEVMRLVDAEALSVVAAAARVGVSRSTAGRMLERARRGVARAMAARVPIHLDAHEDLVIDPGPLGQADRPLGEPGLIALASESGNLEDPVAGVFGRAACFILVGSDACAPRVLANPGHRAARLSGKLAAKALRDEGVGCVAAGRFGPDALDYLERAGVCSRIAAGLSGDQTAKTLLRLAP